MAKKVVKKVTKKKGKTVSKKAPVKGKIAPKKANKVKRRGMASGVRKAAQASQTGVTYLNIPKGIKLFKEESDKTYSLDHVPYIVKDKSTHPDRNFMEGDLWFRFPFLLHRGIGPDKADFVCPRSVGRVCKVCDKKNEIYNDPEGNDEHAKTLVPKKRDLFLVVPKKSKSHEEIPHLWDISFHNYGKMLIKELDYEEEYGCFAELEGGYTLKVRFTKDSFGGHAFPNCDRIDFKQRDDYDEEILEELPDLQDCLIVPSDSEIENFLKGIDFSEDDTEEDDTEEDDTEEEDAEDDDTEEEDAEDEDSEEEDAEDEDSEEEDAEDDEDALTKEDVLEMKKPELIELIKENKLKTKTKGKLSAIRDAVINELGLDEYEEEEATCPHGYEFGTDNGDYDECTECDVYEECLEALE